MRQDGIELLVSPDLAEHTCRLSIELKRFLVFRNLRAAARVADGLELGRLAT